MKINLLILATFLFAFTQAAMAAPYAPVLDASAVEGNGYLKFKVRSAAKKIPESSKVPVPAYGTARLFAISEIASTSDSTFQMNKVLSLATTDSKKAVVDFYSGELSGWTHKTFKNQRDVFLKTGEQYFWGGRQMLEGPRLEVIDISNADSPSVAGVDAMKLLESAPEMKTLIKVYFEDSTSDLIAVDTAKVVDACVKREVAAKGKMMPNKTAATAYLKNIAQKTCKKVEKACNKDSTGRRCQRYARKYRL